MHDDSSFVCCFCLFYALFVVQYVAASFIAVHYFTLRLFCLSSWTHTASDRH